jgi:hypothetical protein
LGWSWSIRITLTFKSIRAGPRYHLCWSRQPSLIHQVVMLWYHEFAKIPIDDGRTRMRTANSWNVAVSMTKLGSYCAPVDTSVAAVVEEYAAGYANPYRQSFVLSSTGPRVRCESASTMIFRIPNSLFPSALFINVVDGCGLAEHDTVLAIPGSSPQPKGLCLRRSPAERFVVEQRSVHTVAIESIDTTMENSGRSGARDGGDRW